VKGRPLRAGVVTAIVAAILIDFAAQPIALYRIDRPAIFQHHQQAPIIGSLLRLSSGETLSEADRARDRGAPALPFRYIVLHPEGAAPQLRAYITSMLPVTLRGSENGIELYEVTAGAGAAR
jgi:hypothetical protein